MGVSQRTPALLLLLHSTLQLHHSLTCGREHCCRQRNGSSCAQAQAQAPPEQPQMQAAARQRDRRAAMHHTTRKLPGQELLEWHCSARLFMSGLPWVCRTHDALDSHVLDQAFGQCSRRALPKACIAMEQQSRCICCIMRLCCNPSSPLAGVVTCLEGSILGQRLNQGLQKATCAGQAVHFGISYQGWQESLQRSKQVLARIGTKEHPTWYSATVKVSASALGASCKHNGAISRKLPVKLQAPLEMLAATHLDESLHLGLLQTGNGDSCMQCCGTGNKNAVVA